jgi:hypothetical protein
LAKVKEDNINKVPAYIRDRVEKTTMDDYRLQWFLNMAYYTGRQWVTADTATNQLIEPPREPWEVRITANRIQPITRLELAKITKNKPICQVVPASTDDNDVRSAKVGDKVCQWLDYELKLHGLDKKMIMWGLVASIGFMKPFWNKNKGDEIPDLDGKPIRLGDIDTVVVSPFDCKWDMAANEWKDVRWFVHEKVKNVDAIYEEYGVEVEAQKDIMSTNVFDSKLRSLNMGFASTNMQKVENAAMVCEYWERPTKKFPKGVRATYCQDKLLYYAEDIGFGDEDTTERELPFFPFIHIEVPGRVAGTTTVEQLIPIQREYNKSRSQVIEHKNLMCNPKWLVEAESLIDDITDEPGQVVEYIKGFAKPEQSNVAPIGVDVYKNIEQCIDEFFFISGQGESSHGETPAGVKSGVAIRFLQEQDDTKIGPTIQNFIDCKNAYMSYMLKIIRYKYDLERTINVVGIDNKVEAVTFKGSDLTSTTVRVQEGSMFATNKSAKQQYVFDLIANSVLNPQTDRSLILKMLEMGMTDYMYDDIQIDINQAADEQTKWTMGDMSPLTRDFFNHQVHINEHNKFRKQGQYTELPPEIQQIIDAHVVEHQNWLLSQSVPMGAGAGQGNIPISELADSLDDNELQMIQDDPSIIDEYMSGGGAGGQM